MLNNEINQLIQVYSNLINVISSYYYLYILLLLYISSKYSLLKGNIINKNILLHILFKILFYLIFYIPLYKISNIFNYILLLYLLLSYLNFNEYYGIYYNIRENKSNYFNRIGNYFSKYWGCKLIKTKNINKQCILALHPHGLLPYCTLINIVTEINSFSLLYPKLSNRVLVVASALFYIPILRDILLSYGLIDASRSNFERWLLKGHTVCVYVGGAHEALYANPYNDILDLKRKTGFMKLAMKHNIPIVPCYTFNEVNHHKQISFPTLLKYPLLSRLRQFIHNSTGLCLPMITSWIPSPQTQVVTVVGKPLYYSKNKSIEKNMEIYICELKELYNKYSPIYNSQKRSLEIYS